VHDEKFLLFMAVLIMLLAVWAVPYPGSLLLVGAAALGGVFAVVRIVRAGRGASTAGDSGLERDKSSRS
jgi:hypothetical protein